MADAATATNADEMALPLIRDAAAIAGRQAVEAAARFSLRSIRHRRNSASTAIDCRLAFRNRVMLYQSLSCALARDGHTISALSAYACLPFIVSWLLFRYLHACFRRFRRRALDDDAASLVYRFIYADSFKTTITARRYSPPHGECLSRLYVRTPRRRHAVSDITCHGERSFRLTPRRWWHFVEAMRNEAHDKPPLLAYRATTGARGYARLRAAFEICCRAADFALALFEPPMELGGFNSAAAMFIARRFAASQQAC